jgi:hypothetical protein
MIQEIGDQRNSLYARNPHKHGIDFPFELARGRTILTDIPRCGPIRFVLNNCAVLDFCSFKFGGLLKSFSLGILGIFRKYQVLGVTLGFMTT